MVSRAASLGARHFSLAVPGLPPYRVLFFGTDHVSLATLQALKNEKGLIEHIEVVCPSDRPINGQKKDTPVPVKNFAQRCGLKVYETPANFKSLKAWSFPVTNHFDVGVVVSFGYFLHPHMLRNLYYGAINMHPSLLPKYRGPAPIHHALLNGDATTGVSVIEIDLKAFDVGRILLQKPLTIKPFIHFNDLVKELAAFGADCVVATLKKLPTLKKSAKNQDDTIACKAPKLKYRDSLISFDVSAGNILHRWQALSDSFGVNVLFRGKVVKFVEVRLPTTEELEFVNGDEARHGTVETGSFIFDKKREALWVRCADASWLLVIRLQQAGRRVGTALDFCNGYRLKNMQRERFVEVDFEAVARSKL